MQGSFIVRLVLSVFISLFKFVFASLFLSQLFELTFQPSQSPNNSYHSPKCGTEAAHILTRNTNGGWRVRIGGQARFWQVPIPSWVSLHILLRLPYSLMPYSLPWLKCTFLLRPSLLSSQCLGFSGGNISSPSPIHCFTRCAPRMV